MTGILDSKSRVLDFILTQEGRNQMVADRLEFSFASFTDSACFYRSGSDSAADEASDRIYFEAASSPFDQIIIERGPEGQSITGFGVSTGSIRVVGESVYRKGESFTNAFPKATLTIPSASVPATVASNLNGTFLGLTASDNTRMQYSFDTTAGLNASANKIGLSGIKTIDDISSRIVSTINSTILHAASAGTDPKITAADSSTISTSNNDAHSISLIQNTRGHAGLTNIFITATSTYLTGSNFSIPYSIEVSENMSGTQVIDNAKLIAKGISNNFMNLRMLGGLDPFSDSNKFDISISHGSIIDDENIEVDFTMSDSIPWDLGSVTSERDRIRGNLEDSETFFQDKRTSHMPNFMYLPPVNKRDAAGDNMSLPLATYENLNSMPILSLDTLNRQFYNEEKLAYKKEFIDINFTDTSRDNNIMIQPFEFRNASVRKLEIIDFGQFVDADTGLSQHVFFVGKVFVDLAGTSKFINLFTIVCSNQENSRIGNGDI